MDVSAGARSLIVSYWRVDSIAAQMLITKVFEALKRDPKLDPAVALQRAMEHLITNDKSITAHRMFWAPFVVVGLPLQ
jgi:CHAT domain-containing protein